MHTTLSVEVVTNYPRLLTSRDNYISQDQMASGETCNTTYETFFPARVLFFVSVPLINDTASPSLPPCPFIQVADTLSLLGLCTQRSGRNAEAEGYIRKALAIVEAAETNDQMEVGDHRFHVDIKGSTCLVKRLNLSQRGSHPGDPF